MSDRVKNWMWGAPLGFRALTRLDTLLAVLLSTFGVVLVTGATKHGNPQGGALACAAVLLMTAPVAWRRAHPLAAVATLAGGALFNAIAVGSYVRCGATLPALLLVVYSVGARCALRPAVLGAALAVISMVTQAHSDPQLKGFSVGGSVLILAMWGVGRLVRSREGMVATLRSRTDELREQRDRTARLAVAADRARVADDLDGMLGERIGRLASEAAVAREAIGREPDAARESLTAIEQEGRRTLTDMREIVGSLRDEPPADPQPSLADLDELLHRALATPARLTVAGDRCRSPRVSSSRRSGSSSDCSSRWTTRPRSACRSPCATRPMPSRSGSGGGSAPGPTRRRRSLPRASGSHCTPEHSSPSCVRASRRPMCGCRW